MIIINLNMSGTQKKYEWASMVFAAMVTSEEIVLSVVCSFLNENEKDKKYSVVRNENEKPLYVLNSETGKKIYFKDVKMNLNFKRTDL